MLVRILIDGMAKMMNGLRLNKYIEAFFYWRNEVIKILLLILHIALVILCILNAKVTKLKLSKFCWAFSSVIWMILLVNDIFHFM